MARKYTVDVKLAAYQPATENLAHGVAGQHGRKRRINLASFDEPGAGKYYGGDVAAPVFAQLMAGALRTLGVPQDTAMKPVDLGSPEQQVQESM